MKRKTEWTQAGNGFLKNPILTLAVSTLLVAQAALARQTGSWGDQGNGRYRNPILESNYPDNDVILVDDTFYMMSSTCHFVPGMVILKSRDLVNWSFSNPIMPAPITFDADFNLRPNNAMANRATWAGSFGFDGTNYFAYWCHNKRLGRSGGYKIVYAKAGSMEGPWSEPREITWANGQSIHSTDPGVMWDLETGQAWMACGGGEIYRMAWDGGKLLQNQNEGITVTKTLRGESAKLYKFDGMYYEMNTYAHGTNTREQVISRAKRMEGPWESRVVLENGNGTDRCPSQGTLLKLADGSWWFLHQLARGKPEERYNGRPQMLEPVTWKDGWPLIGVDTDGNGIGEVVWEHKKPIAGFPVTAPASDDDFSNPDLGLQWNWRFNPKMDRWSLTERRGFLRLKACVSRPAQDRESIKELPNVIGQRLMGKHGNVMTAKFDFGGMANGQEGGMHLSAGDHNVIGVRKDAQGNLNLFFKIDAGKGRNPVVKTGIAIQQPEVWLRANVENGLATFFYSLDGEKFTRLGDEVRLLFAGFTPNMVGFYTMNAEEKGHMDVDWFKYDYDGPKGQAWVSAATNSISLQRMRQVYEEVKTPFKYGVVIRGETNEIVDCPSVFRKNGQWFMVYAGASNKIGYETFLARSTNLLHWDKLGKILSFPPGGWDQWQRDGGIALCDPAWGGSSELQSFDGKYWMSYIGGGLQGYETDPLAIGIAWTKTPTEAREWTPIPENPVLSPNQPDVRDFEKLTLYKSQILWDKSKMLGHPFVMYYNAKFKHGYEQIGMAVSDDMIRWRRYGGVPVVANGEANQRGISGDPQIVRMDDLWVMFYFGAFWKPGAFDTFACSTDLVNWTQWTGEDLIKSSEPWDAKYAHKPWVIKHDGVVYHFYCAVGNQGRVIALATSREFPR